MKNFGLYIVITNPVLEYQTFTEVCVEEEAPMLQLREKHLSDWELLKLATKLRSITRDSLTKFIINDRPDLAILAKADGLHLGQDDFDWEDAARILQADTLIGISTHNSSQVEDLENRITNCNIIRKPDYMSFGPIYPTTAKEKPDPAVGTELLKQVLGITSMPVVAIGGIFPSNIEAVLATGVRNIAMIRHISVSKDKAELREKIRTIKSIIREKTK